jgi:diketogulonate reductase-like aldo/keto reductase
VCYSYSIPCSIGSPARPDRDRTRGDTVDIEEPVTTRIAREHGVHPAALCVKWAVQRGQIPIPFSNRREHYLANLRAAASDPLTDDEMAAIAATDRNCRLIMARCSCGREPNGWEDLWDLSGEVTSV